MRFSLNPLEKEQVVFKCQVNDSEIGHKRLRHFHSKGLQFLQRNDMARGLPNLEEQFSTYKACLMGKQARFPFKESTWRAIEKLQLIHSDLYGLQATPSLNGMYREATTDPFRPLWSTSNSFIEWHV